MAEIVNAVTLNFGEHGVMAVAPENVPAAIERFARVAPQLGADAMTRAMELRAAYAPQPAEVGTPAPASEIATLQPQLAFI